MNKFNLQMFSEAIQGARIVYLYRVLEDAAATDGLPIAFNTEAENSMSRDADSTQTKDGPIRTPGSAEVEISLTSILAKDNEMVDKLKIALKEGKLVELWEVNLDQKGTGADSSKYKATYYQGYITELNVSANAEDPAEVSMTYGPNGTGQEGYATLTDSQIDIATYVFKDVKKETASAASAPISGEEPSTADAYFTDTPDTVEA